MGFKALIETGGVRSETGGVRSKMSMSRTRLIGVGLVFSPNQVPPVIPFLPHASLTSAVILASVWAISVLWPQTLVSYTPCFVSFCFSHIRLCQGSKLSIIRLLILASSGPRRSRCHLDGWLNGLTVPVTEVLRY